LGFAISGGSIQPFYKVVREPVPLQHAGNAPYREGCLLAAECPGEGLQSPEHLAPQPSQRPGDVQQYGSRAGHARPLDALGKLINIRRFF
jgi:hypothetical protein